MARAGVAAASAGTIGTRWRRSIQSPVPTPPRSPPNQLSPPRLKSSDAIGPVWENSIVDRTFAPIRPPMTPAMAADAVSSGSRLRLASRSKTRTPTMAARPPRTPKLVISRSPALNRPGYMATRTRPWPDQIRVANPGSALSPPERTSFDDQLPARPHIDYPQARARNVRRDV